MTEPTPQWNRGPEAALQFERWAVRYFLGPWVADLVAATHPRAGEQVLDLACGTGAVTRVAVLDVGASGLVAGLDIDRAMLHVADVVAREEDLPRRWVHGEAGRLPFATDAFDLVLCQQGLQFFPDHVGSLAEIRRVLRPEGRVGLIIWAEEKENPYFAAIGRAAERYMPAEAVDRLRASYALADGAALKRLLIAAGLRGAKVRLVTRRLRLPSPASVVPGHMAGASLAPWFAQLSEKDRLAFVAAITADLADHHDRDGIIVPFAALLATTH